ncbi:MAG: S8 family serine peptidase [Methanoregulaceae archaeon]|nr:S8 family serine peptidase [Methanoregulaceae archaeon]
MLPLVFACVAQGSAPSAHQPIQVEGMLCHPTRLMVKLRDINDTSPVDDYRVLRTYPQIGYAVVEVPLGSLAAARAKLQQSAGVERADFDRAARVAYTPNDELWPDMWHARTIKADLAWDVTFGSSNVIVGVIDTGLNTAHPDLAGNVWVNAGEVPGNGLDDDGNGFVDDVHGYDFYYDDGTPNDVNGHGTACAGLVAAVQDNTIGVTGVAPRAKVMGLKCSTDEGYFYDSANVAAYLYAHQMGAKIVSCSFFSDRVSQSEMDAIDYIAANGVLPIVAAGNAATVYPYYPGAYENVLGVAATTSDNTRAGFSNFGSWVDVAAPGVSLRTTTAAGGYTAGFGGTSGATPQVAGLAALIWGAVPNLTVHQVRSIIEDTSTALSWDFSNYGLVNCDQAVRVALGMAEHQSKNPVVRYMTPYVAANRAGMGGRAETPARIYGRGFEAPRNVRIQMGTRNLTILRQTRNYVDFMLPNGSDLINVHVDKVLIKSLPRFASSLTAYTMIEAASQGGGWVTGGFAETARADGINMTCTRRSDGLIRMDGTFRKVTTIGAGMRLQIRRHYSGVTSGTEKIYLYDWSSASLPYGSFRLLSTLPAISSPGTNLIDVPEPWRYIDEDGTMYLRVETVDTLEGAVFYVDQAMILQR